MTAQFALNTKARATEIVPTLPAQSLSQENPKVYQFTDEHTGQPNTRVSCYADNQMSEGNNPPIGLLLCTEKDHTVVKYALAGMSNQIFVSKYQVALPTEAEIQDVLVGVMG